MFQYHKHLVYAFSVKKMYRIALYHKIVNVFYFEIHVIRVSDLNVMQTTVKRCTRCFTSSVSVLSFLI